MPRALPWAILFGPVGAGKTPSRIASQDAFSGLSVAAVGGPWAVSRSNRLHDIRDIESRDQVGPDDRDDLQVDTNDEEYPA